MRANLPYIGIALALMLAAAAVTTSVDVNGGLGWDGVDYARMSAESVFEGSANTALRPIVPLLNRPLLSWLGDTVRAYRVLNLAFAALLCVALLRLVEAYGGTARTKVMVIGSVFMTIAVAKYAAYYPVQVDLGAYAILSLALSLIVRGPRVAAGTATVVAVLAREFALAVVAFGVVRDLRLRTPPLRIAATWGPAIAAAVGWRLLAARLAADGGNGPIGIGTLLGNLAYLADPAYLLFLAYFTATVFGGMSLLLLARSSDAWKHVRREPEWGVYAGLILLVTVVGDADLWRYLAYLLPVAAVLFVVCAEPYNGAHGGLAAAAVLGATAATQRPWQPMDMTAYFVDWFPYYFVKGMDLPNAPAAEVFWLTWSWRLALAGVLVMALRALPGAGGRLGWFIAKARVQ